MRLIVTSFQKVAIGQIFTLAEWQSPVYRKVTKKTGVLVRAIDPNATELDKKAKPLTFVADLPVWAEKKPKTK